MKKDNYYRGIKDEKLEKYLLKYIGKTINILLDTSASTMGDHHNIMESIPNGVKYFLFQVDTEIRAVDYISSKLRYYEDVDFPIGLGGTELQPSLDNISKRNNNPILIITDGYTDALNIDNIKNSIDFILFGSLDKPIVSGNKKYSGLFHYHIPNVVHIQCVTEEVKPKCNIIKKTFKKIFRIK